MKKVKQAIKKKKDSQLSNIDHTLALVLPKVSIDSCKRLEIIYKRNEQTIEEIYAAKKVKYIPEAEEKYYRKIS